MKAWELLGESSAPDGTDIQLTRCDGDYLILANGKPLMSSRLHGSEEALATLGCSRARTLEQPRVLVGGLGMGFTLRAVLDVLPSNAVVTVAELVPAVIEWNRTSLAALAGHPLRDPRVRIQATDVTATDNARLYDNSGVAAAFAALRPNGTLAVWSAWDDRKFEQRLRFHGFLVEVAKVRARLRKGGPRHTIFVAHKSPGVC
jgi:spermidine synthase